MYRVAEQHTSAESVLTEATANMHPLHSILSECVYTVCAYFAVDTVLHCMQHTKVDRSAALLTTANMPFLCCWQLVKLLQQFCLHYFSL
eukprot:9337-Heterococcus_DN1.PRE.9